ncbi:MAG: hypothetical protein ACI4XF_02300 [Oscillospiraceae bacterium]
MSENVITTEQGYIALKSNTIDIIRQNLKNQPLSFQLFDTVKSPSGGSTVFTVPGIAGDEIEKSITGIILDYTTPRAYWETSDPVEGTPPTCYSRDSLVSFDGKACCHCPFNDFGSKDGESNAKACKESVALIMLRPGNIMPIIVRIPVSSKIIFQRYLTRLIGKMMPISSVVTKITLEKTTNRSGQPYSQYSFEAVEVLSADEAAKAKAFGEGFMAIMAHEDNNRSQTA